MKTLLFLLGATLAAAQPVTVKLWPGDAPDPEGFRTGPEHFDERNDQYVRLTSVSDPTITVYRPENPNGTAILICPGGGYQFLAMEHEGSLVVEWLNSIGVTALLLKYRVSVRNESNRSREPLQDAQRAMGILRKPAGEWGIRADRIGIIGFSAGGHLCVMATLHANERTYERDPKLEAEDATPNFTITVYPAWLVDETGTRLRPEVRVTPKSPPICIVHGHTDKGVTSAAGSALLYLEYKKLDFPAELHIYTLGGHGFGMLKQGLPSDRWFERAAEWLQSGGGPERKKS